MADQPRPAMSRLARRPLPPAPPITGIGAGDEAMQRVSGSRNPGVDAAMGGMDPAAQRREMEAQAAAAQEVEDNRELLLSLVKSGQWSLPGDDRTPKEQLETLEGADENQLAYYVGEYEAWQKQQQEVQDRKDQEFVKRLYRIGPEHPEYRAVMDGDRRKDIEDGLAPLDFSQMMMKGYVDQTIPVRPGFSIVLRSLTTRQGLWLERLGRERLSDLSNIEQQHTYALWQVALSLQAYLFGTQRTEIGHPVASLTKTDDFDAFVSALDARMDALQSKPEELTHDFITQYVWFCGRVRALIAGDTVKRLGN
jgi:hypothetical protein